MKEEREMEFCVVTQFERQELGQSYVTEKAMGKVFWKEWRMARLLDRV